MASLKEGEWSCYGSGQFNGGRMIVNLVRLIEGEWSCYGGGQFNRGSMIVRGVVSLM